METSTPLTKRTSMGGRDLHRTTLIKNTMQVSPLRRRSLAQTPVVPLQDINDEKERSSRRSIADMQRRLSSIPNSPLNDSTKFLGEQEMKDHLQICTRLFNENKISSKNAWKLHIIDLLKYIAQKPGTDTLQLAGTSLDISAKVYGIRVDDIHADGLKLASNISRFSNKELPQNVDNGDAAEADADKENAGAKRKKKKRRLLAGEKLTICKDPRTLQAPLPKLESVLFSARTDVASSAVDNLFTNTLKMDNTGYKFMLLSDEKGWTEQPDPVIQRLDDPNRKRYPLAVLPLTDMKICASFADFQLDDWNPNEEEKQLALQQSILEKQQEVVFDDDGIPLHEIDGSIHDAFDNIHDDDQDDIQSIHEEVAPQIRGDLAKIVEFRPNLSEGTQKSEYSYNPLISTSSGKLIDQIWAGPSHWKLKFIRGAKPRFSGQVVNQEKRKVRKKRVQPQMVTFDEVFEEFDMQAKLKIKKKPPTLDINKILLPMQDSSCTQLMENIHELMLRPGMCVKKKSAPGSNQADYEVGGYRYENPNDSLYCSQNSGTPNRENPMQECDDGDDNGFDNNDCDNVEEEHRLAQIQQEFIGENLVDAPEIVPKSYVPYALQSKKMDMKKLKSAVWQCLTNPGCKELRNTQGKECTVIPTTFSKLFEEVPKLLPNKMQRELSCPLAFVALLHLCNEHNLALRQRDGYKDFDIK